MVSRTKALHLVSVICCMVLVLSAVQVPAVSRGAASVESFAERQGTAFQTLAQAEDADWFQFPLSNYISPAPDSELDFGDERAGAVYHLGEDVHATPGTSVFATANGEVKLARSATDFEGVVIIEHRLQDGSYVCSIVGHLDPSSLHPLGPVTRGKPIGVIVDGIEPHLHFGIRKGPYANWPTTDWGRTTDASILNDWWDPTDFVLAHGAQEQSGQRLAYIGSDNNLWLMNADDSGRTQLTQDGLVSRFAWAPDGQSIAIVRMLHSAAVPERATDVNLLSLASSAETQLLDDLAAGVWSIAWTPDGTRLALLTYNWPDDTARVVEVDAGTGGTTVLDSWQPEGIGVGFPFITSGVAWSPDGKSLLVYGYPTRTEVLTVDAGAVTQKVFLAGNNSTGSLQEHRCLCPRWSPDGSLIACHDFETIFVVTPDGNLVHELPVSEPSWQSPAWSPDGIKVATGGRDGLWVIDTHGGERTQLVTREAWEPSWSPDGGYITFSLVEGLGGEFHELQGIGVIGADGRGLQVFDAGSYLALWQPLQVPLKPACGTWDGSVSDERIELTRISESSGDECRGAFTFSNETGLWDLGGYTLELEITRTDNANAVWIALQDPDEDKDSTFLFPPLDMELHTFPVDPYTEAQVSVKGEMTLASLTGDTTLFLLETALTLAPGGSCLVPEEQLAFAVLRVSHIVAPAVQLAWQGDLIGAGEELQQILPEFLDRSSAVLKEMGIDCGAEALKALIGKPAVILKLVVAYLTWVPVAIYDYFKYEGRPVYATMVYEVPAAAAEPVVPQIHWTDPQLIGAEGQGGPTQQLLLDRDGQLWAFWEEHLHQSSAEFMYDAVHYRVWEENAWGDLVDIPGSENYGEPSAVVLPDGSILVKAESPGEAPYGWFLWNGDEWSTVPQMSLVKQANESIRIVTADGYGYLHLLGIPIRTWDGTSWRETGSIGSTYFHGTAIDATGNLYVVGRGQTFDQAARIEHWSWNGDTWSAPELIYTAPTEPQTRIGPPALAIDKDGVFHVAWVGSHWQVVQSGTPPPSPHWLSYTRGERGQWSEPETIFGPVTVNVGFWAPVIEVTPDGVVVIAWSDVGLGEGYRVYVTWGRQGNWAEPVVLSPEDGRDHHWADLEIDSSGRVHVLWSANQGGVYHVVGSRADLVSGDQ